MAWGKKQFSESIRESFSKVPNSLLSIASLKPLDKLVFVYIYSLNEEHHPSVRKIAEALSVDKDAVNRSLKRLEIFNLIHRQFTIMKSETSIILMENWLVPTKQTNPQNQDKTVPETATGQSPKSGPIKYLKDVFTRDYPKREGLQEGLKALERMPLTQAVSMDIEKALKNYCSYIKKQNIQERYRLSLSKFLTEWPAFLAQTKKSKPIHWGNQIEDGGTK